MNEKDEMNVIIIDEADRGTIGVAKNYYSAVQWLINACWITGDIDFWDETTSQWRTLRNVLGKDWERIITESWDIAQFNSFFDQYFRLNEDEVIWY